MYTSAELQLLREAVGGASLPGIDTPTGNLLPAISLIKANTITTSTSTSGPGYYYNAKSNQVVVYQDGVTLSGIDFGSASLQISADNVTVKNCTFEPTDSYYSIMQSGSGATVENSTFTGPKYSTVLSDFIASPNEITIKSNSFIDAPADGIHIVNGVVTGNYFSGGGYATKAHADAIWVTGTTNSVSITNNFIDWTTNADASVPTNNAIRVTGEGGNATNVTISGNYLLGGAYTLGIGSDATGTLTNVDVTGNYIGFGTYGAYVPSSGVIYSGNKIFDWRNSNYSDSAWASYLASGLSTSSVVVSTGGNVQDSSTASTTLYAGGYKQVHLYGGLGETNYVGGYGRQFFFLGAGANIITELSVSDSSSQSGVDSITGFDAAKDVIDLSRMDANLTIAGMQNFTFIGASAFSGAGAQVRYQLNPSTNNTTVEAKLAGDSSADLTFVIAGVAPLSAANFALTSSASKSAASDAASLSVAKSTSGSAVAYSYKGVLGRSYSSYQSIATGGATVEQNFNLSASTNQISLTGSNVTITRGSSAESIAAGTGNFAQPYHANETIQIASGAGTETFKLGSHFGSETINGFVASGATADAIILPVSSFSYLNSTMTQAEDLAAVIGNATSGSAGLAIHDSLGDTMTLAGVTATALASSSSMHFA
jgi:hypothetical protein